MKNRILITDDDPCLAASYQAVLKQDDSITNCLALGANAFVSKNIN